MPRRLAGSLAILFCAACLEEPVAPREDETTTPDAGASRPEPRCGDGVVNRDEPCDGTDLGGATCASLGFADGTLGCTDTCAFDTAGCAPLEWPRSLPPNDLILWPRGIDVAMTPDDGVLVAGSLPGAATIDLGGGSLVTNEHANRILYVARYDRFGHHLWDSGRAGSDFEFSHAYAVASDSAGNTLVTGAIDDTIGDDDETPSAIVVQKFDVAGERRFERRFPMTHRAREALTLLSHDDHGGLSVGTDAEGNVIVVGHFVDEVDLGGGLLRTGRAPEVRGLFLASFTPDGHHRWSHGYGFDSLYFNTASCVTPAGHVFVSGSANGTTDLGDGTLGGASDFTFLAKFDAQGELLWSDDRGIVLSDLACLSDGGAVAGGFFADDLPGPGFVIRFDAAGMLVWERLLGVTGTANAVAVTKDGEFIVGGAYTREALQLGDALLPAPPEGLAGQFVARLNSAGAPLSAVLTSTGDSLSPSGVAVGAGGEIYAAGSQPGVEQYVRRVTVP